jgi:hypothetical protein
VWVSCTHGHRTCVRIVCQVCPPKKHLIVTALADRGLCGDAEMRLAGDRNPSGESGMRSGGK